MPKQRLENLTDGVFAIAMTLLVFNLKVPDVETHSQLLVRITQLLPLITGYALSFVVLSMFWLSHHQFYTNFVKSVNRQLLMLNLAYLFFVICIPFSTLLVGTYFGDPVAMIVYGINMIAVSTMSIIVVNYAIKNPQIETAEATPRIMRQARIRYGTPIIFSLMGMVVSHVPVLSFIFFAFPIMFNITPGSLDFLERTLGIEQK